MINAVKFKEVFGVYATEIWAMPESDFLLWLNGECNGEECRTGKWINHKDEHQCSICGEVVIGEVYDGEWGSNGIYEYCPYCGVKMEVDDEGNN